MIEEETNVPSVMMEVTCHWLGKRVRFQAEDGRWLEGKAIGVWDGSIFYQDEPVVVIAGWPKEVPARLCELCVA